MIALEQVTFPESWNARPIKYLMNRESRKSHPDGILLSLYRDHGVIPKDSRDDNHNRAGKDLSAYQLVEVGDLVINKMKAWQGSVGVSSFNGIVSPAYFVYSVSQNVHGRFLHYQLRSLPFVKEYQRFSSGVRPSQWDLNPDCFGRMCAFLPPLSTQKAIANFLDRKTMAIDVLIEKKQKLLALLKEKRAALINQAVTKGLDPNIPMKDSGIPWIGEIPAHWEVKQLRRVLSGIEQGWSPQCHSHTVTGSEWGVLKSGCTAGGQMNLNANKTLPDDLKPRPNLAVRPGDVVVSRASGSPSIIGSAALVPKTDRNLMLSDKLFRLLFDRNVAVPEYFVVALGGRSARAQIVNAISGAEGLANNLPQGKLKEVTLACPPLREQQEIVSLLAENERLTSLATHSLKEQISKLQEYRQALITAAVTGQIEIPEDSNC